MGGLAFSAAAWCVSARDRWIGWDDSTRQHRFNLVVNNSRFLILPPVKVNNLASHVLALAAKQLAIDWQDQYAIAPVVLETFVEQERFCGTCYRAANWIYGGQTKGRGRQSSNNTQSVPIKDVYVYPLYENVPAMLNRGSSQGQAVEPRVAVDWADEEFGPAESRLIGTTGRPITDHRPRFLCSTPGQCFPGLSVPSQNQSSLSFFRG